MSDQQTGPGWWQASDGKWYPPTLHPGQSYQPEQASGGSPQKPPVAPMASPEPKKKMSKWKIGAGAFVGLMVLGAISNGAKDPKGDKSVAKDAVPAATSTSTSTAESVSAPTTAALPVTTAVPPTTAPPTTTVPKRIELSGTGDSVIEFPQIGGPIVATAGHGGSRNFVVKTSDNDLLVNTIGNYLGTVLDPNPTASNPVEITADGAWTISITGVEGAPLAAASTNGTGSTVMRLPGDKSTVALTHTGERNFVVRAWDVAGSGRSDLAVNTIGAYEGTVILRGSLIEIKADGNWTLTIL